MNLVENGKIIAVQQGSVESIGQEVKRVEAKHRTTIAALEHDAVRASEAIKNLKDQIAEQRKHLTRIKWMRDEAMRKFAPIKEILDRS